MYYKHILKHRDVLFCIRFVTERNTMKTSLILLVLPALAYGSIRVHIKASPAANKTFIVSNGSDAAVISDMEQESFNLTASTLKAAVTAHAGGSPLDLFLKSPTPWGDLYKTYKWSEVTRDTKVNGDKIVAVTTETVTLARQSYSYNVTSGDGVFTGDMKADVENWVRNNFTGKKLTVNADYNVDLVDGLNPPMRLKLVSHLGSNSFVKDAKKIQAKVKFSLKPAQAALFVINATKVNIDVLINYESSLSGYVAANYNPRYQGHHFWAYDVKEVMGSLSGMSAVQKSTDLVTIEYFTDAIGYVTDMNTRKVIASVPADYQL